MPARSKSVLLGTGLIPDHSLKQQVSKLNARALKMHWLLCGCAGVGLLVGAAVARVSSSAVLAPLTLTVGDSTTLSVFRVFGDDVRVSLQFDRKDGSLRPELGQFPAIRGLNSLEFKSPGETVVLRVQGPMATTDYEALPAGTYGAHHVGRDLVVAEADGDRLRFPWLRDSIARPKLSAGLSRVTLSVVEVGSALSGEKVTAVIGPPLSFKSAMPGYGFLWWFLLWPVFAVPLIAYAGYLFWLGQRSRTVAPSVDG